MKAEPTVSITVRIPLELRSRMDAYMLRAGRTVGPRVTQQSLVIAAITSTLDQADVSAPKTRRKS